MIRYTDAYIYALLPLIAGTTMYLVARLRKANTYSPFLAVGVMLIATGIVLEVAVLGLSVLSMVPGVGRD